jgi:hypothetical protein
VSGSGDVARGEAAAYASSAFAPPLDINTLTTRDDPERGTLSTVNPSRRNRVMGACRTGVVRPSSTRLTAACSGAARTIKSVGDGPISRVRVKIGMSGCAESISRPGVSRISVVPTV